MAGESSAAHEEGFDCPWCHARIAGRQEHVLFELCGTCGLVWLDFGHLRPRLYQAVEAQVSRWETGHGQHHEEQVA